MFVRVTMILMLMIPSVDIFANPIIEFFAKDRVKRVSEAMQEKQLESAELQEGMGFNQVTFTSTTSAAAVISGIDVELIIEIEVSIGNQ